MKKVDPQLQELQIRQWQLGTWLKTHNRSSRYYEGYEKSYQMITDQINKINDQNKSRSNKVLCTLLSGAVSIASIVTVIGISNSSLGAMFDRGMKGAGKFIPGPK
jgi:hypothetical protein